MSVYRDLGVSADSVSRGVVIMAFAIMRGVRS